MLICGSTILAIILGFLILYVLKWSASCVVWGFIASIIISFLALAGLFYKRYQDLKNTTEIEEE